MSAWRKDADLLEQPSKAEKFREELSHRGLLRRLPFRHIFVELMHLTCRCVIMRGSKWARSSSSAQFAVCPCLLINQKDAEVHNMEYLYQSLALLDSLLHKLELALACMR